jgi:hypothetical protein
MPTHPARTSQQARPAGLTLREEWDEWVAGAEERERDLWETVKRHDARARARKQAQAEAASRPKRRRFFGLLPL